MRTLTISVPKLSLTVYESDYFHRYLNQTFGEVYDRAEPTHQQAMEALHSNATSLNMLLGFGTAMGPSTLPKLSDAPASNSSRFYSVDIGLVHIAVLDLNVYYMDQDAEWRTPQLDWLKKDLAAAAANRATVPWVVVVSHYVSSVSVGKARDKPCRKRRETQ